MKWILPCVKPVKKKVNKFKIGQQLSNGVLQCSSHTIACFASLRDTSWQIHQHQILILFSREWVQRRRRNYLLNLLAGKMGLSQGHWSPTLFLLFVQIEEDEPHSIPEKPHWLFGCGYFHRVWGFKLEQGNLLFTRLEGICILSVDVRFRNRARKGRKGRGRKEKEERKGTMPHVSLRQKRIFPQALDIYINKQSIKDPVLLEGRAWFGAPQSPSQIPCFFSLRAKFYVRERRMSSSSKGQNKRFSGDRETALVN